MTGGSIEAMLHFWATSLSGVKCADTESVHAGTSGRTGWIDNWQGARLPNAMDGVSELGTRAPMATPQGRNQRWSPDSSPTR
jgi:hypothetical protein